MNTLMDTATKPDENSLEQLGKLQTIGDNLEDGVSI